MWRLITTSQPMSSLGLKGSQGEPPSISATVRHETKLINTHKDAT
jgi:hypothetical protein